MKGKLWRNLKIGAIGLLLTVLIGGAIILRMGFRWSDTQYTRNLGKNGVEVTIHRTGGNPSIRSVTSGEEEGINLVFLHGAPGSSKDYQRYLADSALLRHFHMTAPDRPGYGYSNYGHSVPSILEQASMLAGAVPDSSIVVGHSFGGPVASALAMFHPEKVKRLILLAPAVDPSSEKKFPINRVIGSPLVKWMLGGAVKVALEEKKAHKEALEEMLPYWEKIDQDVFVLHGQADNIVPVANAAFLKEQLVNAAVEVETPENMKHIMIWTDFESVRDLLLDIAQD